jgi:hypothetical protein
MGTPSAPAKCWSGIKPASVEEYTIGDLVSVRPYIGSYEPDPSGQASAARGVPTSGGLNHDAEHALGLVLRQPERLDGVLDREIGG